MPETRKNTRLDYNKLNSVGFTSGMSEEENVIYTQEVGKQESREEPVKMADDHHDNNGDPGAEGTILDEEVELDNHLWQMGEKMAQQEKDIRVQQKRNKLAEMVAMSARLQGQLREVSESSEADITFGTVQSVPAASGDYTSVEHKQHTQATSSHKAHGKSKSKSKKLSKDTKTAGNKGVNVGTLKASEFLKLGADAALSRLGLIEGDSSESDQIEREKSRKHGDPKALERVMRTGKSFTNSDQGFLFGSNSGLGRKKEVVTKKSVLKGKKREKSEVYFVSSADGSSESDTVCHKLKWPHENLGARYNNFGKTDFQYKNLDMRLLSAGEINICNLAEVSGKEKSARLKLLGDIMFNSAYYQWQALLRFHAAVLTEVELGNMCWGDDYYRLEQQMLMPFPLVKERIEKKVEKQGKGREGARGGQGANAERPPIFCGDYQRGECSQGSSHHGWFFGSRVMLHHICSKCLKCSNTRVQHPSTNTDCPNYER